MRRSEVVGDVKYSWLMNGGKMALESEIKIRFSSKDYRKIDKSDCAMLLKIRTWE